jgi:two-component system sensor histidine kinase UhpB
MFVVSLLLVTAIGMSFMVNTERRSIITDMNQRAAMAFKIIDAGFQVSKVNTDSTQHLTSEWMAPLNQLAHHNHLTIQITVGHKNTGIDQTILQFPQQYQPHNINLINSDWINRLFSAPALIIEKIFSPQQSPPIKVLISTEPVIDVELIKLRIYTFLSMMTLLASLVYTTIKIMTARFLRELDVVNKGIKQIETGYYRTQLPDFYFSELTRLSDTYNLATDKLEKIRLENQALAERLLWLQEEERQFLAQELHDELGQSISAIKVMCVSMQTTGQTVKTTPGTPLGQQASNPALFNRLRSITDICDHLYTVVRDLMKRLRPTVLDELGLKAALEEVVSNWRQRYPELEISLNCDDSVERCDDTIKINIYRIVQESLTNTVKHADAQHIDIKLREYHSNSRPWAATTYYQLDIMDDGKGFNAADKRFGYGLVGMRERVKSMGGRLKINSSPGTGTTILAQVPEKTGS